MNRPPLPPMPDAPPSLLASARTTGGGDRQKNAFDVLFRRVENLERRVAELESGRPSETEPKDPTP
jgi:hypothetical protein